ncbi:MAG: DMT family transporter [candidate division Zixibacteria bacterium]|nr:DMT family transporter [candidate division Zixibacteria bacterium]
MNNSIPHLGEMAAIGASLIWSMAVILFKKSGEQMHPISLNLFKDIIALLLLLPTLWIFGETLLPKEPAGNYLIFLLSGALGIGLGDTFFFKCLNLIGAGLYAIIGCLYIPIIITLSISYLGETLSFIQVIGIIMIVAAVPIATIGGAGDKKSISRRNLWWGIFWGVMGMIVGAISITLAKRPLEHSPLLWATATRLLGGIITLGIILIFYPERRKILAPRISRGGWFYTIGGSFAGAYLSMILWLMAMQLTKASITSAITQTSNVFIFLFAAFLLREPINLRRIIGIILAVGGTFLVTFG